MTIALLMRIAALICFVLVALKVPPTRIDYLGAGLTLWLASALIPT